MEQAVDGVQSLCIALFPLLSSN